MRLLPAVKDNLEFSSGTGWCTVTVLLVHWVAHVDEIVTLTVRIGTNT